MQWYVRHRETESSERFFALAMGPERGLQPRICNSVIRADDMPEGAPVTVTISSRKRTVDENRFGTDFNIFPDLPHFLGHIRKGWANFLINN